MNDRPPIAAEAPRALRRHVLDPLLRHGIDTAHGGFLVDLDDLWQPAGPQDKSLEHAARTTIVFALLAGAFPGEGLDRLVHHGCDFLRQAMWDDVHGGFYARVDRAGRALWDGLKHPHGVTYAGRAFQLSAPFLPPGEGWRWAERAQSWLDDVARDRRHGGYWGSYRRDNTPYPDRARLPTPDGRDINGLVPGFKEINTQGDALELLTGFAQPDPAGPWGERARALAELIGVRLMQPGGVLPFRYLRDWRCAPDLVRPGHALQMAHRVLDLAAVLPMPEAPARAAALVDFCLTCARHPAGGFCFAITADGRAWPATGPATDIRQWWVQIEAFHALDALARHAAIDPAARRRYRRECDTMWEFIRDTFFDEQHGGIHAMPVEADVRAPKSHCWKDCSHETFAFLALRNAA
jgi:mannose/cellobiose epimerase-like protein (N-acyl-D-glucosamine 2-epimerase family)